MAISQAQGCREKGLYSQPFLNAGATFVFQRLGGTSHRQKAGQLPREEVALKDTPRQEPTLDLPSPYSSKVVSQPQICQIGNPPWLETVTHPVMDFPKTNLLDDLSLVRHQYPPNILACRINHFNQNWEKLTINPWFLQQVMGHIIDFHSELFQFHQPSASNRLPDCR